MKIRQIILGLLVTVLLFTGCEKDDSVTGEGTLKFRTTVWNAEVSDDSKKSLAKSTGETYTLDLINTRHLLHKIEITTDEIAEGVSPDDINWLVMYESSEEMLATDREISVIVPAGEYIGFRITQRNLMYWVCELGDEIMEIPSLNNSELPDDAQLINYFGEEGLHEIEDGLFVLRYPNERLGSFEVKPDRTTNVTMRMNLKTLDWIDNDGSGNWSEGDELTNWTVPEGITTMTDFIVGYE